MQDVGLSLFVPFAGIGLGVAGFGVWGLYYDPEGGFRV